MQQVKYVRLYTDENGESHFEDLALELAPVDFAPPAAPLNMAPFYATTESIWLSALPGWAGETPHPSPRRQVFCSVQGEYEITASDGEVRRFRTGAVLLLDDTWGKGHGTRIMGDEATVIFGVTLAESQPA